jgi:hypothetical protein
LEPERSHAEEEAMDKNGLPTRRELFVKLFPACSLCLGCSGFQALTAAESQKAQSQFLGGRSTQKADMNYEEIFKFAYGGLIPVMKSLAEQMGKEKFLEMLKRASSAAAAKETEETYRNKPKRDLATLLEDMRKAGPLYQHALTYEFVKDTEKEAEIKITECLWARTFRQANAADIGYALICHGDIGATRAFNPKITLIRPKLLMNGDNECRFRWTLEA